MKKRFYLVIGLWVIILPFLGFPNTWRKILFILTGAAIIFITFSRSSKDIQKKPDEMVN